MKTLIMLLSFLEQARGRPTCSLRATWGPRAPRWWSWRRRICTLCQQTSPKRCLGTWIWRQNV